MRIILLFALMALGSCTTKIYFVRHSEKLDATRDTPLSPEGLARAMALRDSLAGEKIDAIYATAYKRTQLTAKPLADAIGKPIEAYDPATLAEKLKAMKNKTVLVVGHSNTIPETILELTGEKVHIDEADFDNLFVVRIHRFSGKATLERKKYGASR
jgi:broad specificity phosphatase PhoE